MKKRLRYFFILISISVILSLAAINAADDAFALSKSGSERSVVIGENSDAAALADTLYENGIIKMPLVFRAYSAFRGKALFDAGEYTFSPAMSYDEIYRAVAGAATREQVKITIPEGMRTDEIIDIFTSAGVGTRDGFIGALSEDYGYDYIPEKPAERTYRYDGYLFPDTYFFYRDATERDVIAKLLKNFDIKFSNKLRESAARHGLTVDECVTLASVVQREAYYTAEMGALASVLHNRLNSKTLRRLECDATVTYAWRQDDFDGDFLDIDSPYNSYKYEGLPPGAICSPGLAALEAAAQPKNTNYYYFFSKEDKTFVFSKTYGEHIAARRKYGV